MRKIFVEQVLSLMKKDANIIFLTADLGFGSFEIIQNEFPARFFNVGIAEQNMIGVACGLTLVNKKVILYSISNFATLRVLEQIRNYLLYHDSKVLIVNGGAGFSYGQLGYTHHAVEDVSIMRSLPQINVFAPFNNATVVDSMNAWYANCNVAYLRLEKSEISVYKHITYTDFGAIIGLCINGGRFIVTYGTIVNEAIKVANEVDVSIIVIYDLKLISPEVYKIVNHASQVMFLEENSVHGGLGEHFFAQCMLQNINIHRSIILGVQNFISSTIGDQNYMRKIHGISSADIVNFFKVNE